MAVCAVRGSRQLVGSSGSLTGSGNSRIGIFNGSDSSSGGGSADMPDQTALHQREHPSVDAVARRFSMEGRSNWKGGSCGTTHNWHCLQYSRLVQCDDGAAAVGWSASAEKYTQQ